MGKRFLSQSETNIEIGYSEWKLHKPYTLLLRQVLRECDNPENDKLISAYRYLPVSTDERKSMELELMKWLED